jgi:hypothetical protein
MENELIFLSSSVNPDSSSIASKLSIDLSISLSDISESGNFDNIQLSYIGDEQRVVIPEPDASPSLYYTPIYKEKINYDVWITTINKNFQELD